MEEGDATIRQIVKNCMKISIAGTYHPVAMTFKIILAHRSYNNDVIFHIHDSVGNVDCLLETFMATSHAVGIRK